MKLGKTYQRKKNGEVIEPKLQSIKIDDFVRKSEYVRYTQGVGDSLPSKYILTDDINVEIRNQQNTNECWAFTTANVLQTNLAKTQNKNILLSPRHMDYTTSRLFLDGTNLKGYNRPVGYGNFLLAFGYITSGKGPIYESDMPFEDNENLINLNTIDKDPVLKLEDYKEFPTIYKDYDNFGNITYTDGTNNTYTTTQVNSVRTAIKSHIKEYGAVTAYTCLGKNLRSHINLDKVANGSSQVISYFNNNTSDIYDHAISIIGWDDNFSKENFNDNCKPKNDGAYIVLNSSGSTDNTLSIMYVSYEDAWIEINCYGAVKIDDIDYDKIYQHDEYGYDYAFKITSGGKTVEEAYAANVFDRVSRTSGDEYLKEVSIFVPRTTNIDIYVNAEDTDLNKMTKVAAAGILETGYHTIEFSTPIKLTGAGFAVGAKYASDIVVIGTELNYKTNGIESNFWDYATSNKGESYVAVNENDWIDVSNLTKDTNVCIKAFTIIEEEEPEQQEPEQEEPKKEIPVAGIELNKALITLKQGESKTLVVSITPSNATNKKIIWTSSDTSIATVDDNGIVKAIKQGSTTIIATTEDGEKMVTCGVTVSGTIPKEDEIYYPDNNSTGSGSTNQTGTIDNTVAPGTIPNAGINITIGIVIILSLGITFYVVIRIRRMRDI